MKQLFIALIILIGLNSVTFADVMPYYISNISSETIGVYQAPLNIKIYEQPNEKSKILLEANWDYKTFTCNKSSVSNLFLVLIQQKELGFLAVTDMADDWYEVIYNRSNNQKGWIKSEELRYLQWRTFYNTYGRKYGLYLFKDVAEDIKNLHASTSETSQTVAVLNSPQKIKLTVVKGNWALINSIDVDKEPKTGYLQWRNTGGEIYAFPAIR